MASAKQNDMKQTAILEDLAKAQSQLLLVP